MKILTYKKRKKSIFKAIFIPVIVIMIAQTVLFYITAVYGGIEKSLNQNAADIMKQRLTNEKNKVENYFNKEWKNLNDCESKLNEIYEKYELDDGENPFVSNEENQISYLQDSLDVLISTLRENKVNGIFLILNDQDSNTGFVQEENKKFGLCIRDMDVTSSYKDTEDLYVERGPVQITEKSGCNLDSWWQVYYEFSSEKNGDYYYLPIDAAWKNPGVDSDNIAYFSGVHQLSENDIEVVSYSIPLLDKNGNPYAVLGIELTTKYLSNLIDKDVLGDSDQACFILASKEKNKSKCIPIAHNGALFSTYFSGKEEMDCSNKADSGGFTITTRNNIELYGDISVLNLYNNNNPFENNQLVLISLERSDDLFYYSRSIKERLFIVAILSLIIGVFGILFVSHIFAAPITSLAKKAREAETTDNYHLEHLGITEIDQLVDSIETLGETANKQSARTEFFSRMSHDMRTPMNAIISFSSTEMLENADEKVKDEYLDKIHESGEYLLGLINEVLDMTKIESNSVDLKYEDILAEDISKAVIPIIDRLAEKKKITFLKEIAIPENLYVKADMQHINQIMINILSNAVKFTNEGGEVKLTIKMSIEEPGKKASLQLNVRDTGIGMSPEFLSKLYIPFEQEKEGNGGTGLGLSICKKLVELMKGSIDCKSKKNEGTEFDVNLLLDICSNEEIRKLSIPEKEKAFEEILKEDVLKGKRVLLCEDHPINSQIMIKLLKSKGMYVEWAENGEMGVELFKKSKVGYYDVIVMDIRMPVMDGLEATQIIRKLERADAKKIPIIATTANAFEEDINESKKAGMNAHLSKPIEPQILYKTLEQLL